MRLRLSVLLRGAPASTPAEIAKAPRRTILGASLTVSAPTGQFFPDKLINLGANRWAFKPEFAVSHPIGEKWLLDAYAGIWLFTANDSFYPGTALRTQEPMGTFQAHISYNFRARCGRPSTRLTTSGARRRFRVSARTIGRRTRASGER